MCGAQSSSELFCIAETRRQHGLNAGLGLWPAGRANPPVTKSLSAVMRKKKGPPGMAVQPKSREETPKVGTPWRAWPSRGAARDMGMFVLRCNLAQEAAVYIGKDVAQEQHRPRPYGNARALREHGDPAAPDL